jgi:recombination protein RecR
MNKSFEYLFDAIKSLPGVGTKQAKAISNFLIHQDDKYIYDFIERIKEAKQNIKFCKQCNNLVSSGELCDICLNHDRNQKKLCIVASIDDLQKIEDTNEFVGLYFVLHEEVNVKTKTNISKEIIQQLMKYLQDKKFNEIILALN